MSRDTGRQCLYNQGTSIAKQPSSQAPRGFVIRGKALYLIGLDSIVLGEQLRIAAGDARSVMSMLRKATVPLLSVRMHA